jgi:hypothetical protein
LFFTCTVFRKIIRIKYKRNSEIHSQDREFLTRYSL